MLSEIVNLDWVANRKFILQDRNGFNITMDHPGGVNASDLLPLSLIGCSAYDIVAILEKQRQTITGLAASAESTRDPDPPFIFRKIHIHYKISGSHLDPAKVSKAIRLSEEKYCGVYATLKNVVEITSDFEILATKETA